VIIVARVSVSLVQLFYRVHVLLLLFISDASSRTKSSGLDLGLGLEYNVLDNTTVVFNICTASQAER